MPKITKIYTKKGDRGETHLGGGQRVYKDNKRLNAYGTVDELNSFIGMALSSDLHEDIVQALQIIQNDLFIVGSDLCFLEEDKKEKTLPIIEERHILALEKLIDSYLSEMAPLDNFILPNGTKGACALHVARTVCRRAEREIVTLSKEERVSLFIIKYINRLSDALFVMARYENLKKEHQETYWDSKS